MRVSLHDHVGSMTYTEGGDCWCEVCGQQWKMVEFDRKRRALLALPYEGSYPASNAREARTRGLP